MDDKDIFNIIDNLPEEGLAQAIDKLDFNEPTEEVVNNELKEKIRKDIHMKMGNNALENNNEIPKINKGKRLGNKLLKGVIGAIAAMILFVVVVNASPTIAYALEKISGIDKLVKMVTGQAYSRDKGFEQIVDQGKYQDFNITVEDKKAEYTVKTIAGDGLKLWIEYEFKGKGLILGETRFIDSNTGEQLDWWAMPNEKYLDIDRTSRVNEFNIEVDVYEEIEGMNEPIYIENKDEYLEFEKKLEEVRNDLEKYKVTTLVIPIKLDEEIFGKDSYEEYILQKNVSTEIGEFTIEKLEISPSKTKVHLNLKSEDYSLITFKHFRMMDSENNIYFDANKYAQASGFNTDQKHIVDKLDNKIIIELDGGPSNLENLKLICDDISYVEKENRYITVDVKNKLVEDNVYGITLNKIEGNAIELNVPGARVDLSYKEDYSEHKFIPDIISSSYNYPENINRYEFRELKKDKIIFEVIEDKENIVDGFEIELTNPMLKVRGF